MESHFLVLCIISRALGENSESLCLCLSFETDKCTFYENRMLFLSIWVTENIACEKPFGEGSSRALAAGVHCVRRQHSSSALPSVLSRTSSSRSYIKVLIEFVLIFQAGWEIWISFVLFHMGKSSFLSSICRRDYYFYNIFFLQHILSYPIVKD